MVAAKLLAMQAPLVSCWLGKSSQAPGSGLQYSSAQSAKAPSMVTVFAAPAGPQAMASVQTRAKAMAIRSFMDTLSLRRKFSRKKISKIVPQNCSELADARE